MAAHDSTATTTPVPARSKAKPRALTLRPHEALRLAEAGEVLIVRLVDAPQFGPNSGKAIREVVPSLLMEPGLWDARYEMDNPRAVRCPLGPVGSLLWGREAWAKSPRGQIYRVHAEQPDGVGSHVVDLATGDTVPLVWMSATSMSRERSRFPRLRHESCEVKRAGEGVTLDEIRAMGWSGQDMIAWIDRVFGEIVWRDCLWCWFSLVRKVD